MIVYSLYCSQAQKHKIQKCVLVFIFHVSTWVLHKKYGGASFYWLSLFNLDWLTGFFRWLILFPWQDKYNKRKRSTSGGDRGKKDPVKQMLEQLQKYIPHIGNHKCYLEWDYNIHLRRRVYFSDIRTRRDRVFFGGLVFLKVRIFFTHEVIDILKG